MKLVSQGVERKNPPQGDGLWLSFYLEGGHGARVLKAGVDMARKDLTVNVPTVHS